MSFRIDPDGVETGVINDLVDFTGLRVLEVGCGDGRLTWRFAEKTASVLALDVDEHKIETARETTPAHLASRVRFDTTDLTQEQLEPDRFDAAVLSYSL